MPPPRPTGLPHLTTRTVASGWSQPFRHEFSSRSTCVPHKSHASDSYNRHHWSHYPCRRHHYLCRSRHYPCRSRRHPCQNHRHPCQNHRHTCQRTPPHQNWLLQRCARAAATARVTTRAKGAAPTWPRHLRSGGARASRQKALPRPSLHTGRAAEALTRPAHQPCRAPREPRPLVA